MSIQRITAPAAEPVSLAEAKAHLRVEVSTDDALIGALITAAREAVEHELERSLITQIWEQVLDAFPVAFVLPRGPVDSIVSVKYLDLDGVEQTLDPSGYVMDNTSDPAYLVPAYNAAWPETRATINAVRVRYTTGYGAAGSDVPAAIRQWMLLQIGAMYDNRAAAGVQVFALPYADRLLDRYRVMSVA